MYVYAHMYVYTRTQIAWAEEFGENIEVLARREEQ